MSQLEHRRNEEILEEGMVEPIAIVMIRRRLRMVQACEKTTRNRKHQSSCQNEDGGGTLEDQKRHEAWKNVPLRGRKERSH